MRNSKVLKKFRSGEFARICGMGHFLPFFIRHAAHSQYDGIWFDLEHRAMTDREVQSILALCQLHDIDCMIRPSTREPARLYRYLEDGTAGFMFPFVNKRQAARQLVRAVKFPPWGTGGSMGREWMETTPWGPGPRRATTLGKPTARPSSWPRSRRPRPWKTWTKSPPWRGSTVSSWVPRSHLPHVQLARGQALRSGRSRPAGGRRRQPGRQILGDHGTFAGGSGEIPRDGSPSDALGGDYSLVGVLDQCRRTWMGF